jgi:formylglycine-generating enzyme required for sulfatase activity
MVKNKKTSRILYLFIPGILFGFLLLFMGKKLMFVTSSDDYCASCHSHPDATTSWKLSSHFNNSSGVVVHCVDCHLPPEGIYHLTEKIKAGSKDLYSQLFKDASKINWEKKSELEQAKRFTFKESCIHCHQNIFPVSLSKDGEKAHLYYSQNENDLHCINCHLSVGHYNKNSVHAKNVSFGKTAAKEEKEFYSEPAEIRSFENFTEMIPGTHVKFDMIAINGRKFLIGSPKNEKFRKQDEGPQHEVSLNNFFIGRAEVSWDEFIAFYNETASEGRPEEKTGANKEIIKADAISGATPPYGPPDQGWGMGKRPAITMTHHSAEVYCRWLSLKTGKKYRLPTEAEWEYACRAGTTGPNFLNIDSKYFEKGGFLKSIFRKAPPVNIDLYINYAGNSPGMTSEPDEMEANPFGLINILGNVAEFCSDWYDPSGYTKSGSENPKGPSSGKEHVIRGGSFKSEAKDLRSAARDHTRTKDWLMTDPQMPKSIWWYSDCNFVGFRVVCEYNENTGKTIQ